MHNGVLSGRPEFQLLSKHHSNSESNSLSSLSSLRHPVPNRNSVCQSSFNLPYKRQKSIYLLVTSYLTVALNCYQTIRSKMSSPNKSDPCNTRSCSLYYWIDRRSPSHRCVASFCKRMPRSRMRNSWNSWRTVASRHLCPWSGPTRRTTTRPSSVTKTKK